MNLLDCLNEVSDFRRKQGLRYPLSMVLLLSIMAIICGHHRYREISLFCRTHGEDFVKLFGLKRPQLQLHQGNRAFLRKSQKPALP